MSATPGAPLAPLARKSRRWEARPPKGVRVPTFRETQRVAHLDSAGREALHEGCPHRPNGRCPVEAAEAVAALRASLAMNALVVWAFFG